jgi:tRNA(His) 5'-end guanylyltransferase
MLARSQFSQKQCQGKSCEQLKDMLINEKKINWNDMATWAKRGRAYIKAPMMKTIPTGPKAGEAIRVMDWYLDEKIPIFTQNRDYINQLVYPMRMSKVAEAA